MIINFIENYAKLVVAVPEDIVVTKEQIDENFIEITRFNKSTANLLYTRP